MTLDSIKTPTRLVLASASPRRSLLLRDAGYVFEQVTPPIDEPDIFCVAIPPAAHAEAMSYLKARICADHRPDALILAADTMVTYEGSIYGKPADAHDARRILTTLGGTIHEVITGVAVLHHATNRRRLCHQVTRVRMRALSPTELDDYIANGAWQGKAGAYGIQDNNDPFVESIEGSFTNVVGLPLETVTRVLDEFGIVPQPS